MKDKLLLNALLLFALAAMLIWSIGIEEQLPPRALIPAIVGIPELAFYTILMLLCAAFNLAAFFADRHALNVIAFSAMTFMFLLLTIISLIDTWLHRGVPILAALFAYIALSMFGWLRYAAVTRETARHAQELLGRLHEEDTSGESDHPTGSPPGERGDSAGRPQHDRSA